MFFLFPDVIIVTRSGPGEREQSPGHAVSRKTGDCFLYTGPGVPVQCQSIAGNILGEITLMDAVSRSIWAHETCPEWPSPVTLSHVSSVQAVSVRSGSGVSRRQMWELTTQGEHVRLPQYSRGHPGGWTGAIWVGGVILLLLRTKAGFCCIPVVYCDSVNV